jgi:two-component system, OmpR family, phosphate regulon response regulator PhoB
MRQLILVRTADSVFDNQVRIYLQSQGYGICGSFNLAAMTRQPEERRPALLLLGANQSAMRLCCRIRGNSCMGDLPVILLSFTPNEDELVRGLALGADDYIAMPIGLGEIGARIRAVLRRQERTSVPPVVQAGRINLNRAAMTLAVEGREVPITSTEFRLLNYLMQNPGRVLTRDQIHDAVWGEGYLVSPSSINVQMRRLRLKIELDAAAPRYLRTARGTGYCFDMPAQTNGNPVAPRKKLKTVVSPFSINGHPLIVQAGRISLNRDAMTLAVEGREVLITATEFRLLNYLIQNSGRVLTRGQIQDAVWGEGCLVSSSSINVQMRRLRVKIELDPAAPRYLRTARGTGYYFDMPAENNVNLEAQRKTLKTIASSFNTVNDPGRLRTTPVSPALLHAASIPQTTLGSQ